MLHFPSSSSSLTHLACAVGLSAITALTTACGDDSRFVNENPPPTGGSFSAGGSGNNQGYGYGANQGSGNGGSGGETPIECADELKRCIHTFQYTDMGETSVEVRGDFAPGAWDAGVPMTKNGSTWSADIDVPWDAPVQYKLVLDGTTWINDPANPDTVSDGFGGFNSVVDGITCPDDFTCAPPLLGDFDWRDAVLYFVFVDRFNDGNPANNVTTPGTPTATNWQGGDWLGVTQKIEEGYFTDLGINTLWLSVPIDNTEASGIGTDGNQYSAYHGYWPKDLSMHEERFGTLDELKNLVDVAHQNDIKVIVDYAMNHVHIDSPVYAQNPDWFWPLYDGGKYCVCGADCGWDGADGRRCWFTDYLPDFNFTNPAARQFSVDNAIFWVQETGIDGFRLDAVKHIEDQWILDLRSRIKSDIESVTQQHFYMVGETYTGDKNTIAYYVDPSTMLDGQFDFPLRASIVSSMLIRNQPMSALADFMANNDGFYGSGIMSTFIGNHDVPRTIHFAEDSPKWSDPWAGGKEIAWNNTPGLPGGTSAFERMAASMTVIFTIPGVPLIYYGDEIGLPGAGDPDNRRFMQWSGYSAGQNLLKDHIKKLTAIRSNHPAMRRGIRTTLSANNDTFAYEIKEGADVVYVLINRADGAQNVGGLPGGNYTDELDGSSQSGTSISVPARSSRILIPN